MERKSNSCLDTMLPKEEHLNRAVPERVETHFVRTSKRIKRTGGSRRAVQVPVMWIHVRLFCFKERTIKTHPIWAQHCKNGAVS